MFDNYDKDKDNLITLDDFLSFYENAANSKNPQEGEPLVRANLKAFGYKEDFTKLEEEIDITELPRYMILNNSELYYQLFQLLEKVSDQETKFQIWQFLNHIPTDQARVNTVKEF